jgi:hypothetical protein
LRDRIAERQCINPKIRRLHSPGINISENQQNIYKLFAKESIFIITEESLGSGISNKVLMWSNTYKASGGRRIAAGEFCLSIGNHQFQLQANPNSL